MNLIDILTPSRRKLNTANNELRLKQSELRRELIARTIQKLRTLPAVKEDGQGWGGSGNATYYSGVGNGPLIDDDSGALFDLIAYQTEDAIDEASWREFLRRCYKLYVQDALAHGWIELFVQHIVGDKFQMQSLDHDPATQACWEKQSENMAGSKATFAWPLRIMGQDCVRNVLNFGDNFLTYNINDVDGSFNCRQAEPVWIYNPGYLWPFATKQWTPNVIPSFGVQTNPEDMDIVEWYWHDPYRNGQMIQEPAANVLQTKMGSRRMKRGRPLLLPVIKPLLRLTKILEARALMHLERAQVAWWYEAQDGVDPEYLQSLLDDNQIGKTDGQTGVNTSRQFASEPGSMQILQKMKKQFSTPNLEAGDARYDILQQVQVIATGLNLSMQTAFGSVEATSASQREGSQVEILAFSTMQDWFAQNLFIPLGKRRIKEAIKHGMLDPLSYEEYDDISGPIEHGIRVKGKRKVPRNLNFTCEFPALRVMDIKALTDSLLAQWQNAMIDRREVRVQLGHEADDMEQRVLLEKLNEPTEVGALAEFNKMIKGGKTNGNGSKEPANGSKEPAVVGKNGRSDSKAIYRRTGTKS